MFSGWPLLAVTGEWIGVSESLILAWLASAVWASLLSDYDSESESVTHSQSQPKPFYLSF